jgi:excisionase family DNA binding protein
MQGSDNKKNLKKELKANGANIREIDITKIPDNDLMTRKEVAEFLGVTYQTLSNWALNQMFLPYFKIGNNVRYFRENVKEFKERYLRANQRYPRAVHARKDEALYVMPRNFILNGAD